MWVYYEGGPKDGAESRLKLVFTGPYFHFDDPAQPEGWYRLTGRHRGTSGRGIAVAEYVGIRAEWLSPLSAARSHDRVGGESGQHAEQQPVGEQVCPLGPGCDTE